MGWPVPISANKSARVVEYYNKRELIPCSPNSFCKYFATKISLSLTDFIATRSLKILSSSVSVKTLFSSII